jgi:uncharacterized protein (DUF488 family)
MSEAVGRVLAMDEGAQIRTIGYGARSVDEFVAVILALDSEYVVDVRSAPYSTFKPEFSREALAARLEQSDVRYVFMGDALGGRPDDPTCYDSDGKVDYQRCRLRPAFVEALAALESGWEAGNRIVLMCSEGKPEECHRTKLIAEELVAVSVPVVHIDERDEPRSHAAIMDIITGGQDTLFGGHAAASTSRKRHRVAS